MSSDVKTISTLVDPWSTKRLAILNKFTTSEKLSIQTSFLSDGEISKYNVQPIQYFRKSINKS